MNDEVPIWQYIDRESKRIKKRKIVLRFILLFIVLFIYACDKNDDDKKAAPVHSIEDTYFLVESNNQLLAVDPDKPDQEIFISDAYESLFVVPHTTDPSANPKISFQFAYYLNSGAIYKLDLRKSSPNGLKPVQVSENLSGKICGMGSRELDWLEMVRSNFFPIYIATPVSGSSCLSAYSFHFINLNHTSNTMQSFDNSGHGPTNRRILSSPNNYYSIFRTDVTPELSWTLFISTQNDLLLNAPNSTQSEVLLNNVTSVESIGLDNDPAFEDAHYFFKINNKIYTYNVIEGLKDLNLQVEGRPNAAYMPDSYPDRHQYLISSGGNYYALEKRKGTYTALQLNLDSENYANSGYFVGMGYTDDYIIFVSGESTSAYSIYALPRTPGPRIVLAQSDPFAPSWPELVGDNRIVMRTPVKRELIDAQGNLIRDFTGSQVVSYKLGLEGDYLAVSADNSGSDMQLYSVEKDRFVGGLGNFPNGEIFTSMRTYRLSDHLLVVDAGAANPFIYDNRDHSYVQVLPQNANVSVVSAHYGKPAPKIW